MTGQAPRPGEFYRHFKSGVYQIITIAEHSETGEAMVVYQALYGEFKIYVRPLSIFTDKVDKEKYPQAVQKYRFERVSASEISGKKNTESVHPAVSSQSMAAAWREIQEEARAEQEKALAERETSSVNPRFLEFLDARSYEAKAAVLDSLREELNDDMIDSMAMAVDLEIPPGDLEERRQQLSGCLRTMARYESSRR